MNIVFFGDNMIIIFTVVMFVWIFWRACLQIWIMCDDGYNVAKSKQKYVKYLIGPIG